jgi:hypothetical protein
MQHPGLFVCPRKANIMKNEWQQRTVLDVSLVLAIIITGAITIPVSLAVGIQLARLIMGG